MGAESKVLKESRDYLVRGRVNQAGSAKPSSLFLRLPTERKVAATARQKLFGRRRARRSADRASIRSAYHRTEPYARAKVPGSSPTLNVRQSVDAGPDSARVWSHLADINGAAQQRIECGEPPRIEPVAEGHANSRRLNLEKGQVSRITSLVQLLPIFRYRNNSMCVRVPENVFQGLMNVK